MPNLLLIRSIPISAQSKAAWKEAGALFTDRERMLCAITPMRTRMILNLGNRAFAYTCSTPARVWNNAEDIAPLCNPMYTRGMFNRYLPPRAGDNCSDFWIKGPGRGGTNKTRITGYERGTYQPTLRNQDVQEHIEGNEYRVVTVGHRVVQQHRRLGQDPNRSYEWLHANDLPNGIRPMAKEVAARLSGKNVIAWDFIVRSEDSHPFLLEGNTSPGVNVPTAQRIIAEMNRQNEEANA